MPRPGTQITILCATLAACVGSKRPLAAPAREARTRQEHLQHHIDLLRKCGDPVRWAQLRSGDFSETYVLFACDQVVKLECYSVCGGAWQCEEAGTSVDCATFDRG